MDKWYFKTYVLITAFLCVGPLALPLLWLNPRFNLRNKIIITIITLIASYYLTVLTVKSLKSIAVYYQQLSKQLQ